MFNKAAKIKAVRRELENGNLLGQAWKRAGIKSSATFYEWVKASRKDRLRRLIELATERGQQTRNDMVEDAQFKRLITGKANGTEYEFYLTNRRPDRWKKALEFAPSGSGAPMIKERPVINYISVHAENATVKVGDNGHGGGNGNGKELARTADHA